MILSWETVTSPRHPAFLVRGTVIARATVPGTLRRFVVEEVRRREPNPGGGTFGPVTFATTAYRVRDAHGITDAEIGRKTPPVVFEGDLDEALGFCDDWVREVGEFSGA